MMADNCQPLANLPAIPSCFGIGDGIFGKNIAEHWNAIRGTPDPGKRLAIRRRKRSGAYESDSVGSYRAEDSAARNAIPSRSRVVWENQTRAGGSGYLKRLRRSDESRNYDRGP